MLGRQRSPRCCVGGPAAQGSFLPPFQPFLRGGASGHDEEGHVPPCGRLAFLLSGASGGPSLPVLRSWGCALAPGPEDPPVASGVPPSPVVLVLVMALRGFAGLGPVRTGLFSVQAYLTGI